MDTPALRVRLLAGATALSVALVFAAPLAAKTLAKVNGVEITEDDLATATEDVGPGLPPQMKGAEREAYVLDYLIDGKIVAQKAEVDKMASGPDFERKMAYLREKLLMEEYLGKIAKEASTDAAIQKAYDEVAAKQKPETELRARHILVEAEADAKKAIERLKGGEDFAKVAGELSKDPASKGGDLGWFTKDRMVPEFSEAAFKLEPGQLSEPVKSQFGWHVIKVDEKRQKEFPKLEQVRDQVARFVVQKAQSDAILKLRETAKIERTEPPKPPETAKPDTTKPDAAKPDAPKAEAPKAETPKDAPKKDADKKDDKKDGDKK